MRKWLIINDGYFKKVFTLDYGCPTPLGRLAGVKMHLSLPAAGAVCEHTTGGKMPPSTAGGTPAATRAEGGIVVRLKQIRCGQRAEGNGLNGPIPQSREPGLKAAILRLRDRTPQAEQNGRWTRGMAGLAADGGREPERGAHGDAPSQRLLPVLCPAAAFRFVHKP